MVAGVNGFATGWVTYFRYAQATTALRETDQWLRRKLRCVRLKQCKRPKSVAAFLRDNGAPAQRARLAITGKGWWRLAGIAPAHEAMNLAWLERQGLASLHGHYAALQLTGNRRGT
jgi:RNA-directed DNA polymerase